MSLRRLLISGTLVAVLIAYFFSGNDPPQREPYIQGRNKTVLFFTNKESGLSNVHMATASALLENYPDLEVHYASFPDARSKVAKTSTFARSRTPAAKDITFHSLTGFSFLDAVANLGAGVDRAPHRPASAGIDLLAANFPVWISPWSVEEHIDLYDQLGAIIDQVDPAVIVLDVFFRPGLDITRDRNRLHAIITPNTLCDNFLGHQPHGKMFWKYPAMSSGFAFPVPLRNIPENIYVNLRFVYAGTVAPRLAALKKSLKARGLTDPINWYGIHRPDVPWITMDTEGASIPMDVVPANVTSAGPIILSVAPAHEQDPELAVWLEQAPTVLVNLGSVFIYREKNLQDMVAALVDVLSKTSVQVIWKITKQSNHSEATLAPLRPYIDAGRLKVTTWLDADVYSLLETGNIVASVHHGGASCFHEALSAGVPHVILPMWADLYNNAAVAETLGIGVWACKGTNPDWTAEGISSAILKVVGGDDVSVSLQNKARSIGEKIQAGEKGRDISARVISKLAYKK